MRRLAPLLVIAALAAPATARAESSSKLLWATVNICDTATNPDKIGIRASMPGNETRQRMFMRFRVQWLNRETGRWSNLDDAQTGWLYAGSALYESRQLGFTFGFDPPGSETFLLRGVVDFRWREKRKRRGKSARFVTVKQRKRVTTSGHPAPGGDPPGYSESSCEIL